MFGKKKYETGDESRNNWFVSIITFGEGWHNNHHFFPGSARQGFLPWEIDPTYYGLRSLSLFGLVRNLTSRARMGKRQSEDSNRSMVVPWRNHEISSHWFGHIWS